MSKGVAISVVVEAKCASTKSTLRVLYSVGSLGGMASGGLGCWTIRTLPLLLPLLPFPVADPPAGLRRCRVLMRGETRWDDPAGSTLHVKGGGGSGVGPLLLIAGQIEQLIGLRVRGRTGDDAAIAKHWKGDQG